MTPKQKASILYTEFSSRLNDSRIAKQCALIAVDEIIKSWNEDLYINCGASLYWQEVKQEIKKL